MALSHESARAAPTARPVSVPRRRRRFWLLISLLIAVLILTLGGLAGTGWYFSSKFLQLAPDRVTYPLRVLALHNNTIELTRTTATMRPGTYSLQWRGGGRITLGPVVSSSATSVVRRFTGNTLGLRVGSPAHLDIFMYSSPSELHLGYRAVKIRDPLGAMPAWYIPGRSTTWVLLVHGRGMSRTEGLRPLPALARLGLPVLDLSYRNDEGAPASSDHNYHFGATEWQDLEAGARYALAHGAHDFILYGFSMGGSIAESFLHHSALAARVRAAVLDSPGLNWSAIMDFRAPREGAPGPIVPIGKQFVVWRLGLGSLDDINHVLPNADFRVRTLLFQGDADTSVPFQANADLAHARPNLVTYVQVPGAEHTQVWNANPSLYTAKLTAFLRHVLV